MTAEKSTETPSQFLTGRIRVDEKTRAAISRLEPGEIAVIDHPDLDRETADLLVAAQPLAVLNAAQSETGRHPVMGARFLLDAGVVVIDDCGSDLLALREGDTIEIQGARILRDGLTIATGNRLEETDPAASHERHNERIRTQVAAFAASVDDFLSRDGTTILEGKGVPAPRTSLTNRPVVLITESQTTAAELKKLQRWVRDTDPVVVVTETGAAAAKRAKLTPGIVVGDMEVVPEAVLRSGAHLIVVQGHDGSAPGQQRLERMGLHHSTIVMSGSSMDAATVILAHAHPKVIVTVGQHHKIDDLIDRGRGAMAPTFFSRLVAQEYVASASAVASAHKPQMGALPIIGGALAAAAALGAAFVTTPLGAGILSNVMTMFSGLMGL